MSVLHNSCLKVSSACVFDLWNLVIALPELLFLFSSITAPQQTSDGFGSEDDTISVDNESMYSYSSEAPHSGSLDGKDDEPELNEKFEEKLATAMENATEKSAATRTLALQAICEILMQRYMPDFVADRKITLMDLAEKGVKRGKGPEQAAAARLAALLILQVGGDEEIIKQLTPLLLTTALDPAANSEARAKVIIYPSFVCNIRARFLPT